MKIQNVITSAIKTANVANVANVAALAVVVTGAVTSGCWSEWGRLFDQTPSTEHRVQDLRVLGMTADPAAFFADAPLNEGGRFADVVVRPFAYDPRGGDVAVTVGLCRPLGDFQPCSDERVVITDGVFRADPDVSLGRVAIDDVVIQLDQAKLDALGMRPLSSVPQPIAVVVDVTRLDVSPPERESATLTLTVRLDPAAQQVVLPPDIAVVCEPDVLDPVCNGETVEPVCGDGVVESYESCDPPTSDGGEDGCDDFCQTVIYEPCRLEHDPVCIVVEPPNLPPIIAGFVTGGDPFSVPTTDVVTPEIERGGAIDVDAGGRVVIGPVVDPIGGFQSYQPFFALGFGDPSCEGIVAECGSSEFPNVRFYVRDGPIDIVADEEFIGAPVNGGGTSLATIVLGDDASGEEAVVVVVSDGRGGQDVAELTLRIQ